MIPSVDTAALLPMILVGVGALFLPLIEVLLARMIRQKRTWLSRPINRSMAGAWIAAFSCILLGFALILTLGTVGADVRFFNLDHPTARRDGLTGFLNATILIAALITVAASNRYLAARGIDHGEFYALILASVLGMMFLTSATDLILLFLALELMSIPIYALAGFQRGALKSIESAIKYFMIGSFASGILLYGCSLLYGVTGSVDLATIADRLDPENPLALLGAGLVLIGLAFKISSVPFHQWAPDVYEGSPTTVTGFMATAVKVAGFGALIRVLGIALEPSSESFYWILWWMAVLSMTVGNVMALIQDNAKRMLAYSSIAHAGYILVGFCVGTEEAMAAVLFYLLIYTFMGLGAFTVLAGLARSGEEPEQVSDLAGLGATHPFQAWVMLLCVLALAGIPGTGGFIGKFQLVSSAVARAQQMADSSLIWLSVILVLNSAVSLGYYLRVPISMWFRDPEDSRAESSDSGFLGGAALLTCALAIILFGLVPNDLFVVTSEQVDALASAKAAAASLR